MDGASLKQRDAVQDEPAKEAKVRQRRELVPYADSPGEASDNRKENAREVQVQPAGGMSPTSSLLYLAAPCLRYPPALSST